MKTNPFSRKNTRFPNTSCLFPGAFSRRMENRDGCLGIAEFVVSPKVVITDMIFYYDQLYSGPSVALEATDAMGCLML